MYKTFFLCVIGFLVLGRPMLCQTGKIDSLNRALDAAKSRIDKTRLLNALSEEFRNYDPSTSIKLADSALTFALNLDDRAEVANAYFNKGRADALLGNFALSRLYLWRAIKLYDELLVSQPALRLVMLRQKSRSLKRSEKHIETREIFRQRKNIIIPRFRSVAKAITPMELQPR